MTTGKAGHRTAGAFKTVYIVGGTHGNERTGVTLVRRWQQDPAPVQRETFTTRLLVANPEAVHSNARFVHQDLNRSFGSGQPGVGAEESYEIGRAREIAERIAADRARGKVFVIDLHTSTSNMGVTLITDTDPVNLALAAHVKARDPAVRIYAFPPGDRINSCLRAAADGGVGLEMGPIPQGVVRHALLQTAEGCVNRILNILDAYHREGLPPPAARTRVFLHEAHVYYPAHRDAADAAFVHRDLDGRDFERLETGTPIFRRLSGQTTLYKGPPGRYPVFINEAAYYRERIAFSLTRPVMLSQLIP